MAGWHHRLDGHEFEQAPGVGDGQGGLASCSLMGSRRVGHDCVTERELILSLLELAAAACVCRGRGAHTFLHHEHKPSVKRREDGGSLAVGPAFRVLQPAPRGA